MLVVGIDPGGQGALCLLNTLTKETEFINTPNRKCLWESLRAIDSWFMQQTPHYIAIEDVHSMGGMSAKSNFQFGRNLGLVEGVAFLCDSVNDVQYVTPKTWQKACGITFNYPLLASVAQKAVFRKKWVATVAQDLYPNAQLHGPKGGLKDGRSDALMIAHYLTLGDR